MRTYKKSKITYLLVLILLTAIALLDHLQQDHGRIEIVIDTPKEGGLSAILVDLNLSNYLP